MSVELRRKCAKCHITATNDDDPNLRFHRFPLPGKHGPLKARVWAEYCYPAGNWSTEKSLKSLHQQHKMLCSKHFGDSSYTSSSRKRLNNFAIPIGAEGIMLKLRQKQCATSSDISSNILEANLQAPAKAARGILRELDLSRSADLTPKERKLYRRCRKNLSEIIRLRKKCKKQRSK